MRRSTGCRIALAAAISLFAFARADAAYPLARLVLEYDSKQEHSDEFQIARDARRRNALQASGFAVLSARHADLLSGGNAITRQIKAITQRTNREPA